MLPLYLTIIISLCAGRVAKRVMIKKRKFTQKHLAILRLKVNTVIRSKKWLAKNLLKLQTGQLSPQRGL